MSVRLIPCPGCSRHVRAGELECPFCTSALGDAHRVAARPRLPAARLGRAATFAFGAAVATSIQVTGCGDSTERPDDAGPRVDSSIATDAGGEDTDAGGEDTDAGTVDTDAGLEDDGGAVAPLYGGPTPVDAGQDAGGGVFPAYGAPPTPA